MAQGNEEYNTRISVNLKSISMCKGLRELARVKGGTVTTIVRGLVFDEVRDAAAQKLIVLEDGEE